MGHTDRECKRKLKKGEVAEYERWLRYVPESNHGYEDRRKGVQIMVVFRPGGDMGGQALEAGREVMLLRGRSKGKTILRGMGKVRRWMKGRSLVL